jgi:hypothetical protein
VESQNTEGSLKNLARPEGGGDLGQELVRRQRLVVADQRRALTQEDEECDGVHQSGNGASAAR